MDPINDSVPASFEKWVGRQEERSGMLSVELAGMLNAAVSHPHSVERDVRQGAFMPCLWHWAAFPEFVPLPDLGRDGHPVLGGFLPQLPFERRMWAGGQVRFSGGLRIDERLHRRSEIVSIAQKDGASGAMVFVSVKHVITGENGSHIEETQDIVYLDIPDQFRAPKKIPVPNTLQFDETVAMNEARLFRYSAATFNAHRIHYDLTYTREIEKYPALIVHGPMQACMLIEAAERHTSQRARSFRYRSLHPMFHDTDMRLVGRPVRDAHAIDVGTATVTGHLGMDARMAWA